MAVFVLVHGGMHGGWCWEKLAPLLEAAGHGVLAPDLPGHGNDATPRSAVTMDSYVERLGEVLAAAGEPAILVGHSMGGFVASLAAERWPERVGQIVYIAAVLPIDGLGLAEAIKHDDDPIYFSYGPARIEVEPGIATLMQAESAQRAFFGDVPDAEAKAAVANLTPQPIAPLRQKVTLPNGLRREIRRTYITTRRDQALSAQTQDKIIARTPGMRGIPMETSHSPFLSRPDAVAKLLLGLA